MKRRMFRTGCASLLSVSILLSQAGIVSAKGNAISTNTQTEEQVESYIAVVEDSASYQKLEKIADEKSVLSDSQPQELESNQMMLLDLTADEVAELEAMDGIIAVEENALITANEEVPVDHELTEELAEQSAQLDFSQWNLDAVDWKETSAYTGKGVNVAVLDSGISYVQGLDVAERKDFVDPDVDVNPLFDDASGHGTSIAGIIAADKEEGDLQGLAEDVNLYSVRVLDEKNEAPVSRVIEGIYWCIEYGIDVINMSFGTSEYSTALERAIQDAEAAGIIMVAAAGNHGDSAKAIDYPAAFDAVIAVGASTGKNEMAGFTSNGVGIDVLAPGEKVWSYNVLQGLMAVDGTSIATAHVTGAVAVLLEKKPEMGTEFAKQLLTASSVQSVNQEGLGILDIEHAIEMQDDFPIQEHEILPRTDVELTGYDTSGIVSGSWGLNDHEYTVTAVMSDYSYITATMARFPDKYYTAGEATADNPLKCGAYHGQHNYVANLNFLFTAACKMRNNSVAISSTNIKSFMSGISVTHTKDKTSGAGDFKAMRTTIVDAFTNMRAELGTQTMAGYLRANDNKAKSYMILGLAAHMLGDTFAHRTMVPTDGVNVSTDKTKNFTQSHFTDWSDFKSRVTYLTPKYFPYGVIEFRDIKRYLINGVENVYEDRTDFYSNRYSASKTAVANLIKLYQSSSNPAFSLSTIVNGISFDLKLNNFRAYAESAGFSVDVSQYSTAAFCSDRTENEKKSDESGQYSEEDYTDYTRFQYEE